MQVPDVNGYACEDHDQPRQTRLRTLPLRGQKRSGTSGGMHLVVQTTTRALQRRDNQSTRVKHNSQLFLSATVGVIPVGVIAPGRDASTYLAAIHIQ